MRYVMIYCYWFNLYIVLVWYRGIIGIIHALLCLYFCLASPCYAYVIYCIYCYLFECIRNFIIVMLRIGYLYSNFILIISTIICLSRLLVFFMLIILPACISILLSLACSILGPTFQHRGLRHGDC
jgi:hypothetical protein